MKKGLVFNRIFCAQYYGFIWCLLDMTINISLLSELNIRFWLKITRREL